MTRPTGEDAMSSEHVEVLWAMLRKCVNERLARKSADREAAALAAAIEALKSAPQPPAEAQPVDGLRMVKLSDAWDYAHGALSWNELDARAIRCPAGAQPVAWEWVYIGGDHYPRGHKVARSLREMDPTNPPYPGTWRPTRPLIYGAAPPPSAPVGVDGAMVERAWEAAMEIKHNKEPWFPMTKRRMKRALGADLAQQPAAGVGEEIMVNAAHDVYTLPLQPSGLSSGPRFVVHVPEQQPAAVDGAMVAIRKLARDMKRCSLDGATRSALRYSDDLREYADRLLALTAQQGGSDNDR